MAAESSVAAAVPNGNDPPPVPHGIKDKDAIQLWKDAHLKDGGALKDVDTSHILTSPSSDVRHFPLFSKNEIETGKVRREKI